MGWGGRGVGTKPPPPPPFINNFWTISTLVVLVFSQGARSNPEHEY